MGRVYSRMERWSDGVVHLLGIGAALVAVTVLLKRVVSARDALAIFAAAVYGGGLLAMIGFSAAYNLTRRPRRKAVIQRFDHAAIFLMIAGSYTPFALISLGGATGGGLLAAVWLIALAGIGIKLWWPRRLERGSVALYLGLGWLGLPAAFAMAAVVPVSTLVLIGLGGVLYSAGVGFHVWHRMPHHNTVWHVFVLAGAGCHYVAVTQAIGVA